MKEYYCGEVQPYNLEREKFLEDAIAFMMILGIFSIHIWMQIVYKIFLEQQLDYTSWFISRRRNRYSHTFFEMYLFIIPTSLLFATIPSKEFKACSLEDYKLIPNALWGLIPFLCLSLWNILTVNDVGNITEVPVLRVMWPVYCLGLIGIAVIIRVTVTLLFRAMWEPSLTLGKHEPASTFWRVLTGILICASLAFLFYLPYCDKWNIPNFIYR